MKRVFRPRGLLAAALFVIAQTCVLASPASDAQMLAATNAAFERWRDVAPPEQDTLVSMLYDARFQEFEVLARRYDAGWRRDPPQEQGYLRLFDSIDSINPFLKEKLDQWVKEQPSFISYGARGFYALNRGFAARGDDLARETPASRMDAMHRHHAAAAEDFEQAVKLNPHFTPGYVGLIGIQRASGTQAAARKILEEAVSRNPTTYNVRAYYMFALTPRWGGSFAAMQALADGIDEATAKANPLLWSLKGDSAAERGALAIQARDYERAYELYSQALRYGNRTIFLTGRADAAWYMKRYEEAHDDYSTCARINPGDRNCRQNAGRLELAIKHAKDGVPRTTPHRKAQPAQ